MKFANTTVVAKRGDITREEVDAIVNAANSSLMGGGGVDGAIHRAGGPAILEECKRIREEQGRCEVGQAVVTGAGNLTARRVIHTVGPVWHGGSQREPDLLQSAYENCLQLALREGLRTVAFPSISTGVYGYPIEQAAPLAVQTARRFCEENDGIDELRFILFSDGDKAVYDRALREIEG